MSQANSLELSVLLFSGHGQKCGHVINVWRPHVRCAKTTCQHYVQKIARQKCAIQIHNNAQCGFSIKKNKQGIYLNALKIYKKKSSNFYIRIQQPRIISFCGILTRSKIYMLCLFMNIYLPRYLYVIYFVIFFINIDSKLYIKFF